jgi:hypothetical protein
MWRIFACVFGLFIFCAAAGCESNGKQAVHNNGQVEAPDGVSVLLSTSPDHPSILITLTVANTSDHVVYVLELQGLPDLSIIASQWENRVTLESKAHWKLVMEGAAYAPFRRGIPPLEKAQYSLDLSSDYIDGPEPTGKTQQHMDSFDHKQALIFG